MNTITIVVQGEESESLNVELSAEEVSALYKLRKENAARIIELDKKIKELEQSLKYASEGRQAAENELSQSHSLMSALGVAEKSLEEESYNRRSFTMSTRIALYIANLKKD